MNNIGKYIKITKRKIHPNLQPKVITESMILGVVKQEGDRLKVTPVVQDTSKPIKVYTVSPSSFEWLEYTGLKDLARDIAMAQSDNVVKRMTTELSEEEIIKVAIVPLIIERVAWSYCERARDLAAKGRIECLKKLSRSFYMLKEKYEAGLREHIGAAQIQLINNITEIIVMWSGGKDSQACLIHSVKKYGVKNVLAVFCDTGWEHEVTVSHVGNVCMQMGVELITLKADKLFEELCIHKHIFPTGTRRFCTVELKVKPFIDWLLYQDDNFIIVQGIRATESAKRAQFEMECDYFKEYHVGKATYRKADVLEWSKKHDASVLRPIFNWSAQQVIDYILANGQRPNELYERGASRVGCFPCVYARLSEIKTVANDKMYRDRLIQLEKRVSNAMTKEGCKANFFQTGKIPERFCRTNKNGSPTVEEVFDYVTRFDNLPSLFGDEEGDSCMSLYHGLCE